MCYETLYEREKQNPNNLSYWFPKVKDCGILVPETLVFTVPYDVYVALLEIEEGGDLSTVPAFLDSYVIPCMQGRTFFLKNGCFSNKFNYRNCITNPRTICTDFIDISYASISTGMFGTGGMTELILRDIIPHDPRSVPAIYAGMPLRTEIRVFYDFDARELLYSENYWNYEYVRPRLRDRTDCIVFDAMRDEIAAGYDKHAGPVKELLSVKLPGSGLTGKWSVDILVDEQERYWLIDMAEAEKSAYWKNEAV